ncbi:MAG: acyl-ACP--UDP-N-acetylglucosamine O-acyltransferase [Pseudomonadota bacterium]
MTDSPLVHPTAVIAAGARLGAGVRIGPFAVIEDDAEVGAGSEIAAHAVIKRYTRMGPRNRIGEHAVIGGEPQDLKFKGWPSFVVIGADNVIREGTTIHRASVEGGETRVGDGNFLMAYAHVAHDCRIGNHAIIANGALVAGFVSVGDRAFVSGNVAIHQFARIGRLAMVGGLARISQDCLPFMITEGSPARARGPNIVGLKRAGIPAADVAALKRAFALLRSGALLKDALDALEASDSAPVREVAQFIREAKRGFTHPGGA